MHAKGGEICTHVIVVTASFKIKQFQGTWSSSTAMVYWMINSQFFVTFYVCVCVGVRRPRFNMFT